MKRFKQMLTLVIAMVMLFSVAVFRAYAIEPEFPTANSSDVGHFEAIPLETNPEVLQLNDISVLPYRSTDSIEKKVDATIEAYDSMMHSFYEKQSMLMSEDQNYTVGGISAEGFPDSFAGAFVNKDLELVILLSEEATKNATSLYTSERDIISAANTDDLIFTSAKYSYQHIVSIMNDIYQYLESGRNGTEGFCIVHYGIDDYNNCVTVGLENIRDESVAAFKSIVNNSDALKFELADPNGFELSSNQTNIDRSVQTVLYPGAPLSTGSAGFRVKKIEDDNSITYGFITAAHCFAPGEVVRYQDNPYLSYGTASEELWQYSGNVDAVFIKSGFEFRSKIWESDEELSSGIDAYFAQGSPLMKSGKTTGVTYGTVTSVSKGFTWKIDGVNTSFTDFAEANYEQAKGDSGGIVVSTRTAHNWIAGIHHGIYNGFSFFCKGRNITTAFNLSVY